MLSSLRSLPNPAQYRDFSVENPRDLQQCWNFFHHSLKETGEQPGGKQFLAILVKILQKDFEVWWKHWRPRRETSWPLLYYCLGGGAGQRLLSHAHQCVLPAYRAELGGCGNHGHRLLAATSLLLSQLDHEEGRAGLRVGHKVELGRKVGQLLTEAGLTPPQLGAELSLLQPAWLAVLVAETMLSTSMGGVGVTLQCHASLPAPARPLYQAWAHRWLGFQQAAPVFRANWHYTNHSSSNKEFKTFKVCRSLTRSGVPIVCCLYCRA